MEIPVSTSGVQGQSWSKTLK